MTGTQAVEPKAGLRTEYRANPAVPLAVGVALFSFAVALLQLSAMPNYYDAGISASAGTFIRHGLVPYRDFWLLYGPLSGYVVAGASTVFGPSMELLRFLGAAVVGAQAVVGFLLLARMTYWFAAALVALAAALLPVFYNGIEIAAWPVAMLLGTAGLVLASRDSGRSRLLAGILIAGAFLSRLDIGGYALIGALVATRDVRVLGAFLAVTSAATAVAVAVVPIDRLWEQLIWYPVVGQRQFRSLAGSPLELETGVLWVIALPVVILPRVALVWAAIRLIVARHQPVVRGLFVFALLCQLQTVTRSDAFHFAQASVPAIMLIGAFLGMRPRPAGNFLAAGVSAIAIAVAILPAASIGEPPRPYVSSAREAVALAASLTSPSEPIFVGETANRFTSHNPVLLYYLVDRRPGVRHTMYNPGITNTERVQREMVASLEASATRVLVLDRTWAEYHDPTGLAAVSGTKILDDYISNQFRVARDFGFIVVMVRATVDTH